MLHKQQFHGKKWSRPMCAFRLYFKCGVWKISRFNHNKWKAFAKQWHSVSHSRRSYCFRTKTPEMIVCTAYTFRQQSVWNCQYESDFAYFCISIYSAVPNVWKRLFPFTVCRESDDSGVSCGGGSGVLENQGDIKSSLEFHSSSHHTVLLLH